MFRVFCISCLVPSLLWSCVRAGLPTVQTDAGVFTGTSEKVTVKQTTGIVHKYLGIPYAVPPVGALRFQKTSVLEKVDSPFLADRFKPACRQVAVPGMSTPSTQSEDCLFLNVYVPDQVADLEAGHAVMVFIHGGAFIVGAGQNYHGELLAVFGNVIVVTINYRLGVFGFFGTGDQDAPGNLGFWDQRTALQWIQQNIGGFGGDKSRVTIFGESAGGTSVLYHALYPHNEGLFQRIISQSGAPSANMAVNLDPKTTFLFVADKNGCKKEDMKDSVVCLQEKGTEQIMDNLSELMKSPENIPYLRFFPMIDGAFIKTHPGKLRTLTKGTDLDSVQFFRSIDAMIGCNSQEGAMFVSVPFAVPIEDPETFLPTREEFETEMMPVLFGMEFGPDTPKVIQSLFVSQYTDWTRPDSREAVRQQFLDVWGDLLFNVAAVEMSDLHAISTDGASSFLYHLEATPSTPLLPRLPWLKGANHADDLPFVFGFKADMIAANQTSKKPFDWEYELSNSMMTYWSTFAKTGNPNTHDRLPNWPEYDVDAKRHVILDEEISIGQHLYAERVNFWLNVIPSVMAALSDTSRTSSANQEAGYCAVGGDCDGS